MQTQVESQLVRAEIAKSIYISIFISVYMLEKASEVNVCKLRI